MSSNCHYSCKECIGKLKTQCAECPKGRVFKNGQCLCPDGKYDVEGKSQCFG